MSDAVIYTLGTVIVALLGSGGVLSFVKHRQSIKDGLKEDSRAAAAEEQADYERYVRRLQKEAQQMYHLLDYCHDLRHDYAEATGRQPRDWPKEVIVR